MSRRIAAVVAALISPLAVAAPEALLDPTRPPAAWLSALERGANPSEAQGAQDGDPKAPVQLVLSGATRRFAIVRGELVGSGADPKSPRLVELKPGQVVIETQQGTETLGMFPGVEKTAPTPPRRTGSNKDKK